MPAVLIHALLNPRFELQFDHDDLVADTSGSGHIGLSPELHGSNSGRWGSVSRVIDRATSLLVLLAYMPF